MPRRSRYTPEQKIEIVLRNIKGETQYALQKEFGVSSSEIRRWKQAFLEAGAARLRVPAKSRPALTELRLVLQKISDETGDWRPEI